MWYSWSASDAAERRHFFINLKSCLTGKMYSTINIRLCDCTRNVLFSVDKVNNIQLVRVLSIQAI